jgi:hypothetical protein
VGALALLGPGARVRVGWGVPPTPGCRTEFGARTA